MKMSQKYKPELKFLGSGEDKKSVLYSCNTQTCRDYSPGARKGRILIVLGCSNSNLLVDDDCPLNVRCLRYKSMTETPFKGSLSVLQPYIPSDTSLDINKPSDTLM